MTQFYSRTDTVYNGGEAIFSFSFSYIKKEDIHVFIDDVETSEWEWLNASQIKVTAPLETGVTVSVRRITPIQDKIVTYENMSMILDDDNLNLSQDQLLNATQELYDNSEQFTIDVEKELNAKIQANKDLIDQNKIDTDKQISDNNDAINARQDAFEVKLNEDIKEVADAADKINQLDESIKLCVDSANNAQTSANNATASAEAAKQAAEEAKKYKNKTITVLKNPIDGGYYLEGNENANTIYKYVYQDKTSVALAFDDIITNTGEQIYIFETFDKSRNAIFRRNIISKDKVERINIKVDYKGTVTFESIPFDGGSGMPVGTIFPHSASATFVPENALPTDAHEYTEGQFRTFYNQWLVSKKLETCTYEQYQQEIATNGACAKFGIDTARKTFKVPFIPDGYYVKAGKGTSNKAGLPNITGDFDPAIIAGHAGYTSGAFRGTNNRPNEGYHGIANIQEAGPWGFDFDASRSNPIYGASETVETNAVAYRYFVVVATGSIKQSEMDWSAWASSLEGKVNRTGDTMTGTLNITAFNESDSDVPLVLSQKTAKGTDGWKFANVVFKEKNGSDIAIIGSTQAPTGENGFRILVRNKENTDWVQLFGATCVNKVAYVIDSYVNGTSGYRIWSDGYCEQWGYIGKVANQRVTLLKSYKDTNYKVIITSRDYNSSSNDYSIASSRDASGFTVVGSTALAQDWVTKGYIW